jgi:hypothetical protein
VFDVIVNGQKVDADLSDFSPDEIYSLPNNNLDFHVFAQHGHAD